MLGSAMVTTNATTIVEGNASAYSRIQTTINGDTTTVESHQPGAIRVQKSDTSETIESDIPVAVTHNSDSGKLATRTPTMTAPRPQNPPNWISLLRTLWDRVKELIWFDRLTEK